MKGNKKSKIKKYCSGVLAFSMLLTNTQIVFARGVDSKVKEEWKLVWNDEFEGKTLDETKWSYDLGSWLTDENGNKVDSGWGNREQQAYMEDNLHLENGNLVITAKKENIDYPGQGNFDYTSSKIKTKGKYSQKYGRFEARIAAPTVEGLWPAFWMMPENDVYGGWASSGEIDIMELRGRVPNQTTGAIHYGGKWPNNTYSGGEYDMPNGQDISQFHTYAVEWEPGEIRWYLDDKEIFKKNNWYTTDENGEKYSFPAPFDQEFYIILNLAVGGWFDNDLLPSDEFTEAEMLVDYVRVYEKVGGYGEVTEEPIIEKEPLPQGSKEPINDNYVYDVNFKEPITIIDEGSKEFSKKYWNLAYLPEFGGEATSTVEELDGENFIKVDISNPGSQSYSVQLIQNVTLTKGHTYKLSYDAKADGNREIAVKFSDGGENGWVDYTPQYTDTLSNEVESFEHIFTMEKDSHINARIEFNMGLNDKSVWIGNVKLEEWEDVVNYDAPKKILKDGNHIYNGAFDKGRVDRLTYWNLVNNNSKAEYSVKQRSTESNVISELYIDIKEGGENSSDIILNQKGIKLSKGGQYELTFDARADEEINYGVNKVDDSNAEIFFNAGFDNSKDVKVIIKDSKENIVFQSEPIKIGIKMEKYNIKFATGDIEDINGTIEFQVGGNNIGLYMDNVSLKNNSTPDLSSIETFPLKNGDFSQELSGWESWSAIDANVNCEDGRSIINIQNRFWESGDGAETWAVQFKQTGLQLYEGLEYLVSFEASASIDREFELVAQNSGYHRVFEDKISLGKDTKKYTYSFVATDTELVELNFLLGKYDDYEPHSIIIDNVIFEVKNPTTNKIQNNLFNDGDNLWGNWSENSDAVANVINGKYEMNISSLGNDFWGVQLFQDNIELEKGKSYRLAFDMESSIPRTIDTIVENSEKILWEHVNVTSEMKTYSLDFVYDGEGNIANKLNFCLGAVEGQDKSIGNHTIILDNVYLYEIPDLSVEESVGNKNIISMEPTEGPIINVGAEGNAGFTFPMFNNGDARFDDIKDDLQVMVKENEEYIDIDSTDEWIYNTNWGHFWDGPGGYWFNPVKETVNVKLVSKTNPNIFIEYTLKVENNQSSIIRESEEKIEKDSEVDYEQARAINSEDKLVIRTLSTKTTNNIVKNKSNDILVEVTYRINGVDKGTHTMISKDKQYSLNISDLKNGDKINYEFTVTTDGEKRIFNDCEEYVHSIGNIEKDPEVVNVENLINSLPQNITLDDKKAVQAARDAYEALTAEQKLQVSEDILIKLIEAEARIDELERELEENEEENNSNVNVKPDNGTNGGEESNLPKTGGINSSYLLLSGIILAIGGAVLIKKKKRLI